MKRKPASHTVPLQYDSAYISFVTQIFFQKSTKQYGKNSVSQGKLLTAEWLNCPAKIKKQHTCLNF